MWWTVLFSLVLATPPDGIQYIVSDDPGWLETFPDTPSRVKLLERLDALENQVRKLQVEVDGDLQKIRQQLKETERTLQKYEQWLRESEERAKKRRAADNARLKDLLERFSPDERKAVKESLLKEYRKFLPPEEIPEFLKDKSPPQPESDR